VAPLVAWLLVLASLGVAGYFARQQVRALRGLGRRGDLSTDDYRYLRNQAWRRLAGCVLLSAVAVMMSYWYLSGQDAGIDALGDQLKAQQAAGERQPRPEQDQERRFYVYYWITVLLLLLGVVLLAAADVWAIRQFGARHYRRIRDDRKAMLERELEELRRDRGRQGHGNES
jgi:high-affinity Fe2+/Pb2+ permease